MLTLTAFCLFEFSGFDSNIGVITIAATNRLDILDEGDKSPHSPPVDMQQWQQDVVHP